MALLLSPAKLVLLAVHLAVNGDVDSLTTLAARHGAILRKDLLLRILLTYLPETLPSSRYVRLIQQVDSGAFPDTADHDIDCSAIEGLAEDNAVSKVKKLRLLPLSPVDASAETAEDALSLFLLRRSYKVDEEAGLLDELPALLLPFLDHSPCMRTLLVSAILPLLRRNREYYPRDPIPNTLREFQQLPDRVAANLLLSQTGTQAADLPFVGRDLRGLIGPWLFGEDRWKCRQHTEGSPGSPKHSGDVEGHVLPGWDEVLHWLTAHAARDWKVAVSAVQHWYGPRDADLGGWGSVKLDRDRGQRLERSYARAALASAYLIPEASLEALEGAYSIVEKVGNLCGLEPVSPLASELALLPPLTEHIPDDIMSAKHATYMRNDILAPSNPLTTPTDASLAFLQALILSAHILTNAGYPCTVRRAGELALFQDERDQKAEAAKLIHAISNNGPKSDDKFWFKARNEILWLRDWGTEDSWSSEGLPRGIFGQVKRSFLEVEILKALLSNTRYALSRSIYEDAPDQPLDKRLLQDTVYSTAMTAYDNASNPNRTRGGLKKCDEIIKAFPKTIQNSDPQAKQIEALLQATHSLSDYRLVLKQREPFTPVVLRVHADPISIIDKVLEQNPKSYTQLHDLINLGTRMVEAGLTTPTKTLPSAEEETAHRLTAERRITAMCINAALAQDDFETAYSYVVNRLASATPAAQGGGGGGTPADDDYSWRAALQAGRYRRNARTLGLPQTHSGGLTSANADVRHLEQRIECLATALRVAPTPTLQEIVSAFRRAEEELQVLVREEEEREDEWDARGDRLRGGSVHVMPGAFGVPSSGGGGGGGVHKPAARRPSKAAAADEDAAPMSLFDLSRASVLSAQRNLSALSGLQRSASAGFGRLAGGGGRSRDHGASGDGAGDVGGRSSMDMPPLSATGSTASAGSAEAEEKRVRKRDQLREAAMGTLVSGVGWLVGAPPPASAQGRE